VPLSQVGVGHAQPMPSSTFEKRCPGNVAQDSLSYKYNSL